MKSRLTRKHVMIAIVSLLVTALVVIGVVVSMHIYTESSVEVLKVLYMLHMNTFTSNVLLMLLVLYVPVSMVPVSEACLSFCFVRVCFLLL